MARVLLAIDSGKFLKPESLNRMWTPIELANGEPGDFGLGWTSHKFRGLRVVGHSGGPALSDFAYFPELRRA